MRLPVGFVYDALGNVVLDPDAGVRQAIAHLFETFARTASASAVVKAFAAERLTFPGRHSPGGPHAGELYWKALRHDHALFVLHNPRHAGAYFYGRRHQVPDINGHTRTVHKPRDQWTVLIRDAHPGYITFEQYEKHQATLASNAAFRGQERRGGPPREGPALLQGLAICGVCGKRMAATYHARCNGELVPDYACEREAIKAGTPPCQTIYGAGIDQAVADLVLETLTPLAIETALQVSAELTKRAADADQIRASSVQRAQYTADAARRRYLAVDPANRLVADQLEADWNHKLRELADTQDEYDRAQNAGASTLTNEQQARIRALAADLPALFNDPATPMRERKRLIRLLITDVTLIKTGEQITAHVRLSGGQLHTLTVPRPLRAWEQHTTAPSTIALIDQLLAEHTYDETVNILNQRGLTGGWGHPFTVVSLTQLCRNRGIPSHHDRLRARGMLTLEEIAAQFGVRTQTVKIWQRRGHITGRRIDARRAHLYHPGQTRPRDGRERQPAQPAQAVPAARHDQPALAAEGTTTTTTPGGAV